MSSNREPPNIPPSVTRTMVRLVAVSFSLIALGCRADVWVESPDERSPGILDTVRVIVTPRDTIFRPTPIDSAAASFAWLSVRPAPLVTTARSYPADAVDAARQFLRALGQTGSSTHGPVGVGERGFERAFTYVHPRVRARRDTDEWVDELEGIVRPVIVALRPVPGDDRRVFAEILVLRDVDGESLLGFYYGHFTAAGGDNGWQLTGARLASEDWQAPLGSYESWRYDRALASQTYADEDPDYALNLVRLRSGEWVPLSRPAPQANLQFGLPVIR